MSKLLEQINTESRIGSIKDLVFPVSNTYNFSNKNKVVFVNTSDIHEGKFLHNNYLDTKKLPGQAKKIIEYGDIVFSEIRPKNRHFALVDFDSRDYVVSTKLIVLKVKKNIDPRFAYLVLTADQNLKEFQNIAESRSGTFPQITFEAIADYEVNIPDIPTQKKIAEILSAYDLKIENNNKIIKNLEATAQAIFNEWFINFRFPGHEKVKMVDSEMGEIPEGWEVKNIKDIFTVILGGTPSREKPEYWGGNISWINSGEVNKLRILEATEHITELGLDKSNARLIKSGATVLAITGATLGQVSRLEIDSTANQSVVGIFDENNILNEYLYLYISNNILDLISGASGGAQQHINKQMVENYKIMIPSEIIIEKFNRTILSTFFLTKELFKENISLKSQRDQLLAKLI